MSERLDIHLTNKLSVSRAQVQKLIKLGSVTVNGKVATAHTLVSEGDTVLYPEIKTIKAKRTIQPDIPVLYEDTDLIVINKPAGIIVHPMNETDKRPSVIGSLLKGRAGLKKVGDSTLRPGIVHRLDRAVSGVMVIAKTKKMFEELKRQFAERDVEKEYIALVYGKIAKDHDTINFKIARSKTLGRMVSRPDGQDGKEALTEYDVIERFKTATLVDVKIHTGRTHQIRTHFKAIGHPVVGDAIYHIKMVNIRPIEMDRLFLHAHKLTITLGNGKRKTFVSPLPGELKEMLETLPVK